MKNRSRTILIVATVLIILFLLFRMRESYEGGVGPSAGPSVGPAPEEDPEVKKLVEEKGITQEDLDALASLL
jgi:hypothetical protein